MSTRRTSSVIPGFGLTMGYTIVYLSLIVLIPLAGLFFKMGSGDWQHIIEVITSPRVLAAFRVSLLTSLGAALANGVIGLLIAWVLVRYPFSGRKFVDALIDLPFALPTAVAGIALTSLYSPKGWMGQLFGEIGIKIAYTPLGISLALLFIGLPFVVRTIQPVLQDAETDVEEAALTLGASRWVTFWKVILPTLLPSWLTGVSLAFARGIGEYGSVVFISGNMPMKTEIVPLLIITQLEQFDYVAAASIAVVMLLLSFLMLFVINTLQWLARRRMQNT